MAEEGVDRCRGKSILDEDVDVNEDRITTDLLTEDDITHVEDFDTNNPYAFDDLEEVECSVDDLEEVEMWMRSMNNML